MQRRQFLVLSAASIGGVLVYSLDRTAIRLAAEDRTVRIPLRFFTQDEAMMVAAATARIFPTDESGPGAREAGVVVYIDRQLAGPYGHDRHRYTKAPFEEAAPELGYQGEANPRQVYREGLKSLAGFDRLSATEQDQALSKIEDSHFFRLLRTHTIEGMFCDPIHGGNAGMIGWQLIGYPGPRMSNLKDVDQHFGEAFRPKPAGLQDIFGKDTKLQRSEDES
jgi:gluconate 2-dehydrogenase gamma chain